MQDHRQQDRPGAFLLSGKTYKTVHKKKDYRRMQRKAEQKKVSACCPESGISDTLKESSAAGEAGPAAGFCKMRESAHEKKILLPV